MENILSFVEKLKDEAPTTIEISVGSNSFTFTRTDFHKNISKNSTRKIQRPLFGYYVRFGDKELNYVFIHNYYNPNYTKEKLNPLEFNRLEVCKSGESNQITCIHFNTVGLTTYKEKVRFNQKVHFANRDNCNKDRFEKSIELLENESLLDQDRCSWHIGSYNTTNRTFIEGSTEQFLRDFIRVAIILGFIRDDQDHKLFLK